MSSTAGPQGTIVLRVLLVDDDQWVRNAVRRILQGPDVEIVEAEDGEAALALLRGQEWQDRSSPVDVVISDFGMPRMNGRELLAQVRQEFPDAVRILMTADRYVGEEVARDGLAEFLLVKPPDIDEVRACLHAARLIVERRREEWLQRSS